MADETHEDDHDGLGEDESRVIGPECLLVRALAIGGLDAVARGDNGLAHILPWIKIVVGELAFDQLRCRTCQCVRSHIGGVMQGPLEGMLPVMWASHGGRCSWSHINPSLCRHGS